MVLYTMAVLAAGLAISSVSGAEPVPCPSGIVAVNVTSTADVQNLTDVLACTGGGSFSVTWYASLTIEERIEVADDKDVTVTGTSLPGSSLDALSEESIAGTIVLKPRNGTRMFAVSNGSTLRLNHMAFEGGGAENGGVVEVVSSSSLFVFGCTFTNNNASKGGAVYASTSAIYVGGNTTFVNNSALYGGAIYAEDSEVSIYGDTAFIHNSAEYQGGALYADESTVSLEGETYFSGNTGQDGGAICADSSEVVIDGTAVFTSNSASRIGGAISVSSSKTSIDGTTVYTNNSSGQFGGAFDAVSSDVVIYGAASFVGNSARASGGSIRGVSSSFSFTGDLSGNEDGLHSEAGGTNTSNRSVEFINNYVGNSGGAILIEDATLVDISEVVFKSNAATLGGAVYIAAAKDTHNLFSSCVFEGNTAEDGGAVYLNTVVGLDIFIASIFLKNVAGTSGGAIFHTGSLNLFDTSFVANQAGIEGVAVRSVGFVKELSNVSFLDNAYVCPAREYGYVVTNEIDFCSPCFDEVCSKCSTGLDGIANSEEVRISGSPVCAKPPTGAKAPSRGTTLATLTLEPGYFRTSNQSHDVRECYNENACRGGSDADEYCTSGYTGPYCAVCAEEFATVGTFSCCKCSEVTTRSVVGLTVVLALAVLLLAALGLLHLDTAVHNGAETDMGAAQLSWTQKCWSCRASFVRLLPLPAIKIVVTVWQIITQFDAIAGGVYPELYKKFVSKLHLINLDLDLFFSYSCLVSYNFYDRLVFATVTPIIVLVLLVVSYFIGTRRRGRSESAMREMRHKHQAAVLYIALLVYSPVSYRIFQTFCCQDLDDGETYLKADYSISCLTSRHRGYVAYALAMVCVYPVGVPAVLAWLLFRNRRGLVKSDREAMVQLEPLRGIWSAYKPSRYYYEVLECGRRFTWIGIASFVISSSTAQLAMALTFAFVSVFITEFLSPFKKGVDADLYRWGGCIIVASMYVAFLMKIDVGQDATYAILTFFGVLVAANIFMVVAVLLQIVFVVNALREAKGTVSIFDYPVRRTRSASVGPAGSKNGDVDVEAKISEAWGTPWGN